MRCFFWFALLTLGLLVEVPSAHTQEGRKVILMVAVHDEVAVRSAYSDAIDFFLREHLPGHEIVYVTAKKGLWSEDPGIRAELISKVSQIQPNDVITHLVVNTHGHTGKKGWLRRKRYTHLNHIGRIYPEGVDERFKEIFTGVRDQFSAHARFVLNACSTLCGKSDQAADRARALISYFGASNGSVYGSTQAEHEDLLDWAVFKRGNYTFPTMAFVRKFFAVSLMVVTPFAVLVSSSVPNFLFNEAHMLTLFNLSVYLGYPPVNYLYRKLIPNRGRILSFRGGKLRSNHEIKKVKNMLRIYGVSSCRSAFSAL